MNDYDAYRRAYERALARTAAFSSPPQLNEPVLWSLNQPQLGVAINAGLRRWTRRFVPPAVPGVTHAVSSWWRAGDGISVRCACGEVRHYDTHQVALMAIEGLIQ